MLTNPMVDMDTLEAALHACFPDRSEDDGETTTISFEIDERCVTTDTTAFAFRPMPLFKRRY